MERRRSANQAGLALLLAVTCCTKSEARGGNAISRRSSVPVKARVDDRTWPAAAADSKDELPVPAQDQARVSVSRSSMNKKGATFRTPSPAFLNGRTVSSLKTHQLRLARSRSQEQVAQEGSKKEHGVDDSPSQHSLCSPNCKYRLQHHCNRGGVSEVTSPLQSSPPLTSTSKPSGLKPKGARIHKKNSRKLGVSVAMKLVQDITVITTDLSLHEGKQNETQHNQKEDSNPYAAIMLDHAGDKAPALQGRLASPVPSMGVMIKAREILQVRVYFSVSSTQLLAYAHPTILPHQRKRMSSHHG
jgi:hypothetical protein